MSDARTPTHYFRSQEEAQQAFDALHSRLDQLVARVQSLKEERARTKAHKEILVDSLLEAEDQEYRHFSREFARNAVDEICSGGDAVEALKDCLDHKAFYRSGPFLEQAGMEMEQHIFGED